MIVRGRGDPKQKRGRRAPPFSAAERCYRFLPAFFFPPLAAFFAIALIPPFIRGIQRWRKASAARRSAAAWHVGPVSSRRPRALRKLPRGAGGQYLKNWGCHQTTPPLRRKRLALLPARLLLAALCSLLGHDSSLEFGSSAMLPTLDCYNRWAERSTLIQDVDYG